MRGPVRFIAWLVDPRRPFSLAWLGGTVAVVLMLDQASKWGAMAWLRGHPPVPVIPHFLQLGYAENTGAAFSILTGRTGLLALVSALFSVAIVWWAWILRPEEHGLRLPLGLILGGAIGNLIDRIRLGYVVDFIDAYWLDPSPYGLHWPMFNVADSAVCIGVGMFVLASLFQSSPAREKGAGAEKAAESEARGVERDKGGGSAGAAAEVVTPTHGSEEENPAESRRLTQAPKRPTVPRDGG